MEEFQRGLVRILKVGTDTVIGNGFLVSGGLIVTCAHVVARALAREPVPQARPDGMVVVVFTFLHEQRRASVAEGGWYPPGPAGQGAGDIALLALDGGIPAGARPLVVAEADRSVFPVRLQPFVPAAATSKVIKGEAVGRNEADQIQIDARTGYLQFVEPGISGAPVFHEDEGYAVEGMVQWRDTGSPEAFACSAAALRQILPRELPRASAFAMDVDDQRSDKWNRRFVSVDVYAPTQAARPGQGVAVQLAVSFVRFPDGAPRLREAKLRLEPRRAVCERYGFGAPQDRNGISIYAKARAGAPYWRLTACDGETLHDRNIEVDLPPLCRIPEPQDGEELIATLVATPGGFSDLGPDDLAALAAGDDGVALVKQRIVQRLKLKALGDFSDEGEIELGRTISVVRELPE